ncbi:pathogenesis-related leaf protein 6-like [Arachis hypogaea]|uniref:pathogenesis-related leaf protein 6-like n=1 Tax=Arachis hypogaea TaxID=3818 RepID=UPI0011056F3B|nr:pathogenesis-related leaf protein 6-like [Arachis hypogaea]
MEQDAKEEHAKEERNTKDSRGSGRATPAAEVVKQDEERTACHQGQLQRAAERLSSPEFYLKYHNAIREHVGSPALKWDREIEKHARNFVNAHSVDCLAKKPSISSGIGWNIARSWGNYTFVGGEALVQWALQHENYDHVTNSCVGGECHAFTQLVWKQSTRLGCARVTCHNHSGTLVRCNYEPPGNIPGQRPY